jgi:hypothetical protein
VRLFLGVVLLIAGLATVPAAAVAMRLGAPAPVRGIDCADDVRSVVLGGPGWCWEQYKTRPEGGSAAPGGAGPTVPRTVTPGPALPPQGGSGP